MMRKISQRNNHSTARGGGRLGNGRGSRSGHRKMARKPVSRSWISHP